MKLTSNRLKLLIEGGIKGCVAVVRRVNEEVEDDPATALERLEIGTRRKVALRIDSSGEDILKDCVKGKHRSFREIDFMGEESLKDTALDLTDEAKICALMDAVDGTDLVERGFGNWCSDVVFFAPAEPPGKRILGSVVTLPSGCTYFARRDLEGAFVVRRRRKTPQLLKSISSCTALRDASICFYGQKIGNLLATCESGLLRHIESLNPRPHDKSGKENNCRIYNLAGVPMMMRLLDAVSPYPRRVDAVFDAKGQQPHDVIPGAYIAMRAGASLLDLSGHDLTLEKLEHALLRPASEKIRYVLAGTRELGSEIAAALSGRTLNQGKIS